jgi:hypothetical protein
MTIKILAPAIIILTLTTVAVEAQKLPASTTIGTT